MKEFFNRLAYKATGFKALFTIAVLTILVAHDLSAENAEVMIKLIYAVLGAKAVQYGRDIVVAMQKKEPTSEET